MSSNATTTTTSITNPSEPPNHAPKDHWTPTAYTASASFVPLLTQEITSWLAPHPTDHILDLGCGDGLLTAQLASRSHHTTALDASPNLISAARSSYSHVSNITWREVDCRYLEHSPEVREGGYDKVFSNAALHWILRDPSSRLSVLRGVHRALKPSGQFVFEVGGAGNVADVHAALLAALVHQGVGIEKARESCPWFFPSEQHMKNLLEKTGFQVIKSKMEYRPTKVTEKKGGGLEGWVRLMCAQFLDVLDTDVQKEEVVRDICAVLETVLRHEDDGAIYLGYVRLKMVARKLDGVCD